MKKYVDSSDNFCYPKDKTTKDLLKCYFLKSKIYEKALQEETIKQFCE